MKPKHSIVKTFLLTSIVLLLVFSGCEDVYKQSNSEPELRPPAGIGYFSLNLGDATLGRTILPAALIESDFKVFTLEFFSRGSNTPVTTAELTQQNLSEPITVLEGTYTLVVTAYMDEGKTKPAAQASVPIVITAGQTTSTTVELAAITNAGQGTFKWTINFPVPTTRTLAGSMSITPIAGTGGAEQVKTLTTGVTASCSLDTGFYRVVFTLRDTVNDEAAERWEILHVYQNMESAYTWDADDSQFHSYSKRAINGNDSGPGSLRQAIEDVPSGGLISVDSSVGYITLTSPITTPKSFVLEGNSVTIQSSILGGSSGGYDATGVINFQSVAMVTIRRVHFTNIRTWVIRNVGGNVNIESCIFSNNRSDNNSGRLGSTIYNRGGTTNSYGEPVLREHEHR